MKPREKYAAGILTFLALLTGLAYAYAVAYDLAAQAVKAGEAMDWGRFWSQLARGLLANWHSAFLATLVVTLFLYSHMTNAAEVTARSEARLKTVTGANLSQLIATEVRAALAEGREAGASEARAEAITTALALEATRNDQPQPVTIVSHEAVPVRIVKEEE